MSRPVLTQDVPQSFCFTTWQASWASLVGLLSVSDDPTSYNFGNTTPAAADRDKPWLRTNSDGTPDGWYVYASGAWLKPYAGPGTGVIVMWEGLEADIPLLDGGEAGAITTTTGAFWERVTTINGRVPIGVGTIPGTSTALAVGDNGGEAEVTLNIDQIPSHDHGIPNKKVVHQVTPSGTLEQTGGDDLVTSTFQAEGGDEAHNNMPPYRALFFIKRSSRIYHRAP